MKDVVLAKDGDKEAFMRLIDGIKFKLYKTGMSILKNDDDTCDAIQETLINAYEKIHTLKDDQCFDSWIIKILIFKCYDIIRKNQKIIKTNEKLEAKAEVFYEMYCEESELEIILKQIDKDLKMVVVLYYYDDLSISSISNILNIPEGTVKTRLLRARKAIEKIYKGGEKNG